MTASNVNEGYFDLPKNLTVRAIMAVQQDMLQFIDRSTHATLQIDADSQADISFIQLMEAARIYAGSAGKTIVLAKPANGSVLDVLKRSGFLEGMSAEDAKFWLHEGGIQ